MNHPLIKNAIVSLLTAAVFALPMRSRADTPPAADAPSRTAAVQLGAPFCDHMVLQRDMKLPVWGWSKPGDTVTVQFAGQAAKATAGKDGKWMVWFKPFKASFEPRVMTVSSKMHNSTFDIRNILVGEVWMASGQSNMQSTAAKTTVKKDIAQVDGVNPIREFQVTGTTAQLHPVERSTGSWQDGDYSGYAAIALAFANKLYEELNVPVGILNCSWSQTAIQAWIPREGFATGEDEYTREIHHKCLETDPRTPEHRQAWDAFYKSLEDQIAASEAAIKNGAEVKEIGEAVPGNMRGNRDANWLFSGRLNPVVPYAIRGAIWNQGYANAGEGLPYYNNLHSLTRGWRMVWDRPELPVYFHQFYTAGGQHSGSVPTIGGAAEMRLGTWMARDIPHAGMASQIDIGGGIHYHCKAVPGERLALQALKNQYGKKVVAEGPMFKSYEVKDDEVIVEFDCADGGLVVADTSFNRSRAEGATGRADPKIIKDGEDNVKLFWVAGEDRVWHPATFEIEGKKVVVKSKDVKKPVGVSYAASGVGFQPCLYNEEGLLPMTPFIQYDHRMVTSEWWPDPKLKIAGETIDPTTVGKLYEYRKMPILGVQFRDDAVLQADQPVTVWGSTRNFGEWQTHDEKGDCKIHFEFSPQEGSGQGAIKKVIPVKEGMAEWSVTLPPMKADGRTYTLKASFTVDGELAHERTATNIVFGDVWYVAAAAGLAAPKPTHSQDSGQIVRMIENESMRGGNGSPSRYSICVSRTPMNKFASYWKPANGLAGAIGHSIAAKTKRPVGIIFMQAKGPSELSHWIGPEFLKDAPSLMEDYKTVGSQYPDNPYYLANVRRYIKEWKSYWGEYIPEMIATKAVPEGARWGANWGSYPSPKPIVGDSKATCIYNIYVAPFSPVAVSGVVFLTGKGMAADGKGANFGPEMSALATSFKAKLGAEDAAFVYTQPTEELAEKITVPDIHGKSTAVKVDDWQQVSGVIDAVTK